MNKKKGFLLILTRSYANNKEQRFEKHPVLNNFS